MDQNFIFLGAVGIILNALFLYIVIGSATRASQRAKYDWAQLELLAKIARAQGVPEDQIQETFKAIN